MSLLTRKAVLAQAWPIILSQAVVPLVGIVDVAVIGRTGDPKALAGVALGATIINLIFWTFGFLRMSVTGLTAQARGAGDTREVNAALARSLGVGVAIGAIILVCRPFIVPLALEILSPPPEVAQSSTEFVSARLFGAPAALGFYAINGWLIGLGRTTVALGAQIVMNGVNIGVDLFFVWGLGMGAAGVGAGTALAEWTALFSGLVACRFVLGSEWRAAVAALRRDSLFAATQLRRLVAVNRDIMVRTLALLILFAWFTNAGARLGAVPLAANHILMQFVSVSAFVLDGFAFTAEARVGAAVGKQSLAEFRRAVRLIGELGLAGGALFSAMIWFLGADLIGSLTSDPAITATALRMLPYCALVPVLGAPSWLLDGIFIGATQGKVLRNAATLVTIAYLVTDWCLGSWGNNGVWTALLASYIYRAISLGSCLPSLTRQIGLNAPSPNARAARAATSN